MWTERIEIESMTEQLGICLIVPMLSEGMPELYKPFILQRPFHAYDQIGRDARI